MNKKEKSKKKKENRESRETHTHRDGDGKKDVNYLSQETLKTSLRKKTETDQ